MFKMLSISCKAGIISMVSDILCGPSLSEVHGHNFNESRTKLKICLNSVNRIYNIFTVNSYSEKFL